MTSYPKALFQWAVLMSGLATVVTLAIVVAQSTVDKSEYDRHYQLGDLADRGRELDVAIFQFNRALDFNPESEVCHLRLADLYLRTDEPAKALDELALVIDAPLSQADKVQALLLQGIGNRDTGNWDGAKAAYATVLTLVPENGEALHGLADIAEQERDYARMVEFLKEVPGANGKHVTKQYTRDTREHQQRLGALQKKSTGPSMTAQDWCDLGLEYKFAGQWDKAVAAFEKVAQLGGGCADADHWLAVDKELHGESEDSGK